MTSRRQFLRVLGLGGAGLAAVPLLAACGGAASVSTAGTTAAASVSVNTSASAAPTSSAAATSSAPATSAASSAAATTSAATTSAASAGTASLSATSASVASAGTASGSTSALSSAAPTSSAAAASTSAAGSSVAASSAAVNRGTATVVYQTWWQEMMDNLKPFFPQFEQQYNAKLDIQVFDYTEFVNKLPVLFASNTPPDTMNANNQGHVKLFDQGVFLDLTSKLKADKIDLAHDYGLMGLEFWCGKNFAMPFDNDPRQVYYNKTLFKEAGVKDPWDDMKGQWTMDDLVDAAQKLTKKGPDGKTTQWGLQMGYTGMSESNGMFVWTFGGRWADFDKMQYTLDSPESIAAHNFVYDLVVTKRCVLTDEENAELTKGGVKDPFREGKTAIYIRASANVAQNIKQMQGKYEWDVAPFPGRKAGEYGVPIVSGNPNEAAAASKQPDLAYNFIKWLAGPQVQDYFATTKAEVPSLNALKEKYATTPPAHIATFTDTYKRPYGIHFRQYRALDAYGEYSKQIAPVFQGKASMETTLRQLNQQLNSSFVQYGSCNPYAGMKVPIQP